MTENYITNLFPVDVGRTREEIWDSLDHQGVYKGEGVVLFFARDGFTRPEERKEIDLIYTTPERLGFVDPPNLALVWKEIELRKIKLDECPMETAASLLDKLSGKTGEDEKYYAVSIKLTETDKTDETKQSNKVNETNKGDGVKVPDLLRIVLNRSGRLNILGWSIKDLIPLDGILVFQRGVSKDEFDKR